MSFLKEFRTFAMRGNVVDLAVGIIIGAAFGRIVSSLVSDVLMPPLGMVVGGIDFGQFGVTLKEAVGTSPAVILKYGVFLNSIIDFVIVAVAVFFLIHTMNRLQKKDPPAPPPPPPKEVLLLTEIRDLLKAQQ